MLFKSVGDEGTLCLHTPTAAEIVGAPRRISKPKERSPVPLNFPDGNYSERVTLAPKTERLSTAKGFPYGQHHHQHRHAAEQEVDSDDQAYGP